jgi:hypothetical protein
MTVKRIISYSVLAHPELFPREENKTQAQSANIDGFEVKLYFLNVLKNLKSKMKTLTRVVGNSKTTTATQYYQTNQRQLNLALVLWASKATKFYLYGYDIPIGICISIFEIFKCIFLTALSLVEQRITLTTQITQRY